MILRSTSGFAYILNKNLWLSRAKNIIAWQIK